MLSDEQYTQVCRLLPQRVKDEVEKLMNFEQRYPLPSYLMKQTAYAYLDETLPQQQCDQLRSDEPYFFPTRVLCCVCVCDLDENSVREKIRGWQEYQAFRSAYLQVASQSGLGQ
jgi:hypothetical protein